MTALAAEPPPFLEKVSAVVATTAPRRVDALRSDLRSSVADAAAFSVMVGLGETYLAAFVLALHVSETASGLIATVPILGGSVLQLITPWAVARLGSNRRWAVACAALQAASFVPLAVGAALGSIPLWAVYVAATLYWASGLAVGPAWNTWMGTLVPERIRPGFFACRSRFAQITVFAGLVAGGLTLQWGHREGWELPAFAGLFFVAGVCRAISTWFLSRQSEPRVAEAESRPVGPLELLRRLGGRTDGHLIAYMLAVQTAIQISGPYFTPFMLRQLQLGYWQYLVLIAASYVAKSVAFPVWGRLARRQSAKRLLWVGGVCILPMSALWIVSGNFYYLLTIQLVSGVVWAAYDLGVFLLIFETIPQSERTSVLTTFNLADSAAKVAGSLVGAAILSRMDEAREAYLLIFGLSALVRIGTLFFLKRVATDRAAPPLVHLRPMAVRPQLGGIERPILPSIEEKVRAASDAA